MEQKHAGKETLNSVNTTEISALSDPGAAERRGGGSLQAGINARRDYSTFHSFA